MQIHHSWNIQEEDNVIPWTSLLSIPQCEGLSNWHQIKAICPDHVAFRKVEMQFPTTQEPPNNDSLGFQSLGGVVSGRILEHLGTM